MHRLVVGMGKSGIAVARYLDREGATYDTFDDNCDSKKLIGVLGHKRFRHFSEQARVEAKSYDQAVISPGVSAKHPLLTRLAEAGVGLVGEIEFAFRRCRGKVVAVTGSNGKSTTTSLIHHILQRNGLPSRLCGNIGVPFTDCVDDNETAIYALEVSSFQLEHIQTFSPDVGLLLNVVPDHLDRHGSFEVYRATKLRLFALQSGHHQWAVYPSDFPIRPPGNGRAIRVPGEMAFYQGDTLFVGSDFQLPRSAITLLGGHNDANALFACVVATYFGLSGEGVAAAMADFSGLPHRLERLGVVEGRTWINDSKATNVHATQAAVEAMGEPYILILGGCDKGERFDHLQLESNPPKAIVAYGETGPIICEDLARAQPHLVAKFQDACLQAHRLAGAGTIVLLAPACASFDQFTSFAHRGDAFRDLFNRLRAA